MLSAAELVKGSRYQLFVELSNAGRLNRTMYEAQVFCFFWVTFCFRFYFRQPFRERNVVHVAFRC